MKMRAVLGLAAGIVAACNAGSGGAGSGPGVGGNPNAPPGDPSGGRWFGTIVVDATMRVTSNNPPTGGASTHHDQLQHWITTTTIDETGARSAQAKWSLSDSYITDISFDCYQQHATALTNDVGDATSQGPLAYFNLADDGSGGYKASEPTSAIGATPSNDTRNHVTTTTCEGGLVQDSVNTTAWPLFSKLPFDRIAGKLDAEKRTAKGSLTFDEPGAHYAMHWSLKRDKELVAKVGGPYHVTRVDKVSLDASQSRGDIDSYTWTVTPGEACADMGNKKIIAPLSVGKEVDHDGKTFEFAVLCPVNIHLVVRGKAGQDEDDGVVTVAPRKKKVDFSSKAITASFPAAQGGSNRCEKEPDTDSGHFMHADDPSWKGSAYTTMQIDQADSPFAGAFYVDTQKLAVTRLEEANVQWLAPAGSTYVDNILPQHDNKPIADLLEGQSRAHEAAHSSLLKGWLDFVAGTTLDPAVPLEGFAAMDEASLDTAAKTWLDDADNELCLSTVHPFVWAKLADVYGKVSGTIYLPTGETYVGPLNKAGDEKLPCEK